MKRTWSRILGAHQLAGPVARSFVQLVPGSTVRRVVAISSAGVADSAANTSSPLRWVFAHSNVQVAFDGLADMERVFASSPLDWLAVRPTRLLDGPRRDRVEVCTAFRLWASIARADVAHWMLDAVDRPHQSVTERR